MKLFKSKYGFSTSGKTKDLKTGEELKMYYSIQFKKGYEPREDVEGELLFKTKDGTTYPCFLSCYNSKEGVKPKIVLMQPQDTNSDAREVATKDTFEDQIKNKVNAKDLSVEEVFGVGVGTATESKTTEQEELPFF